VHEYQQLSCPERGGLQGRIARRPDKVQTAAAGI
jgi:hypothetical protein